MKATSLAVKFLCGSSLMCKFHGEKGCYGQDSMSVYRYLKPIFMKKDVSKIQPTESVSGSFML